MTEMKPGDPAPDFELNDAEGKPWKLSDRRGRKVIVYFYPIDDTPGCTREGCDFRDSHPRLQEAGYDVVGISPQDQSSHAAFSSKYSLNFPLLVDSNNEVAIAFGVVDAEDAAGGNVVVPRRSTFVIGEDGTLEQALYKVRSKGHVESLIDLLQVG
jgi:thioredoxin-dependent peroxiredoxin